MPERPPPPAAPAGPYGALRLANFRRYVVALLTFTIAVQIQGTVVGWQVYELTHDKLALGLIGLAEALPFIGTALYAGHVADRHDRRSVALWALAVLVGCSLALLALPLALASSPRLVVPAIYAVIVISGFARAFLQPARQALAAEIVPRALQANAISWRTGVWQLASVVGPAIGGGLYALGGTTLSYGVDATFLAVGITAIATIRHRSDLRREHIDAAADNLLSGLRFVWRDPVLLGALSLDLFSVLFGGATALLPVFADEILHVGPGGLGLLRAAPAIGAVAMSIVLAWAPPFQRTGRVLLRATAGFGLSMIAFGLSDDMALSVTLLILSGAFDMVSVFVRTALIQFRAPAHMLGRVTSVNAIFAGSSNEIGAFESGAAARLLGTVPSVVLGGAATLAVVAITAIRVPTLRRLGRIDE